MSGSSVWWSVLSPPNLTFTWNDYPELYQTISKVLDDGDQAYREVSVKEDIRIESIATDDKQAATVGEPALIQSAPAPAQEQRRSPRLQVVVRTAEAAVADDLETRTATRTSVNEGRQRRKAIVLASASRVRSLAKVATEMKLKPKGAPQPEMKGMMTRAMANATKAEYLVASQNLFPILMVPTKALEIEVPVGRLGQTTANLSFFDLFKYSLTGICDRLYGPAIRAQIQAGSKKQKLRNFFEVTEAQDQCTKVIQKYAADGSTKCWICDTVVGRGKEDIAVTGLPECEHKLPVLWALIAGGLFVQKLYDLMPDARRDEYLKILKMEYGWSHSRCNQIKNDDLYIQGTIVGQNPKQVRLEPNPTTMTENLTRIIRKEYPSYRPLVNVLRGVVLKPPIANDTMWIEARVGGISTSLKDLITKLNARDFPVHTLVSRFAGGLLNRAVVFAKEIVAQALNNQLTPPLTPDQRATLTEAFTRIHGRRGGRQSTRSRRNVRMRTYRQRQRGGDGEDTGLTDAEAQLLEDIAFSLAKAVTLPVLEARYGEVIRSGMDLTPEREYELQSTFIVETELLALDCLDKVLKKNPTMETFFRCFVLEVDPLAKVSVGLADLAPRPPTRPPPPPPTQPVTAPAPPRAPTRRPPPVPQAPSAPAQFSLSVVTKGEEDRSAPNTPKKPPTGSVDGTPQAVTSVAATPMGPSAPDPSLFSPSASTQTAPTTPSSESRRSSGATSGTSGPTTPSVTRTLSATLALAPQGGGFGPKPNWL